MSAIPSCRIYAGTDDGLWTIDIDGGSMTRCRSARRGDVVRDVAAHPTDPDRALCGCGLGGWGLYRTTDAGATTEQVGFADRHVWGVDRHPADPHEIYIGTEPPGLYRQSEPNGEFTPIDGVHDVPSRDDWTFFYEPFEAGHIHGLSAHPDQPDRLFAAVEIGGLLWSADRGDSWHLELAGTDIHRTAVDPTDSERVFATAETGLYESRDGGQSWELVDGTAGHYCGPIVFDTAGTAFLTGGEAPGAEAFVLWGRQGDEWIERDRLPADGVAGRFSLAVVGTTLIHAVRAENDDRDRFVVSRDGGATWTRIDRSVPTVRAIDIVRL